MDEQEYKTFNSYSYDLDADKATKEKKTKKEHSDKGNGFVSKLFIALALGLAFGAMGAAGFFTINRVLEEKVPVQESAVTSTVGVVQSNTDFKKLEKEVNDLKSQLGKTGHFSQIVSSGNDVTGVVDMVMPAMVSVTNVCEETYSFFGRSYSQQNEYNGSGIIIGENDTELLIVTNYHVIENTVQLSVQFADSTRADAYVKGYDSSVDIAVIAVAKEKLEASTLGAISIAEMGNSEDLKIGQSAIAIGNALGYGQSVTTGVISALNCDIELENSVACLIQTSAAINPGNSGGALLNNDGQVIGINSAKIGGDTVEGMGYAIPISEVKDIIEELSIRITRDKVAEDERGYLGIAGLDDNYYSTFVEMGYPAGVYIQEVYAGSAAEKAGLYKGDVITKCDGQTVSNITALQDLLSFYKGGEEVTLSVKRLELGNFTDIEVVVTLGDHSVFDTETEE